MSNIVSFFNFILRESKEQHTTVIPMVGFSPISHMGHATDLGGAMDKLPGSKHLGISQKADAFTPEERKHVLEKQWKNVQPSVHIVSGAGETIRHAYDSLSENNPKHLHILVGADRLGFAQGLKKSLEAGKIKEMGDKKFDSITVHTPEDKERTHGMSGTKMRAAANEGDEETFHKHLGPAFSRKESNTIMKKVKAGIDSGKIPLKR
jgi:hypothetical protein